MGSAEEEVRRALAAGDGVAACALVGRMLPMHVRRELEAFVDPYLRARSSTELAAMYAPKGCRDALRQRIDEVWKARMEGRERDETVRVLRSLAAAMPRNSRALYLLVTLNALSVPELRELVVRRDDVARAMARSVVFALVRRGDTDWLVAQLEADALTPLMEVSAAEAVKGDAKAERSLLRCAAAVDRGGLLRAVLEHLDVPADLVAQGLRHPESLPAALLQAHRLPDPRSALEDGLTHPNVAARRAALVCLLRRPDPALREFVTLLLTDPDPWDERGNPQPVAQLAAAALERM